MNPTKLIQKQEQTNQRLRVYLLLKVNNRVKAITKGNDFKPHVLITVLMTVMHGQAPPTFILKKILKNM